MTEALAWRISGYLVSIDATKEEDREVISYGLFHILAVIAQIIFLAIPALIIKAVPEIVAYTVFFTVLKRNAGGTHAKKHWICLWEFTLLAIVSYYVCTFVPISISRYLAVLASFVMITLVILRAPVAHPNNPLSAKKTRKMRKRSISISIIEFSLITAACIVAPEWMQIWILCGAVGSLTAAITLILPMPR